MRVQDVMSSDVRITAPDVTLRDAAMLMRECDCGFLPVGENDRLVGTITDRDIAIRAVAAGKDPTTTTVREAMSIHVAWVYADQKASEAADIMCDRQIRRLPVLNRDKRLIGVVSLGDIADRGHDERLAGHALEEVSRHGAGARH
jgi:CBS domain-containing protein